MSGRQQSYRDQLIARRKRKVHTMDALKISEPFQQSLRQAKKVVVFTGAGVSAESGIPTFRDAMSGLWSQYRAEDLATRQAFRANPKLVWEWYEWRRELVAKARPNAAHIGIARLQDCVPELTVITQNVDGLHQAMAVSAFQLLCLSAHRHGMVLRSGNTATLQALRRSFAA
jgi:NAD-dependent SIR2 family protein deacetylase